MNNKYNNQYNRPNYYNQTNWRNFGEWKKKQDAENPWDAESIKPPYSRPVYVRNTNKRLQGIQNALNRLSKNNELLLKTSIEASPVWHKDHILKELAKHPSPLLSKAIYHNLLYRAKQLAYLQPIFDLFLDPPCKGLVYISTIGTQFWVIGTTDAHAKANFNSNQKTFRVAFEGYLKLKNPKFVLPKFKVIHYRFSFPPKPNLPQQIRIPLTVPALAAMNELKNILKQKTKMPAQRKMPSDANQTKPFHFKDYPKANLTPYIQSIKHIKNAGSTNELQHNVIKKIKEILESTPYQANQIIHTQDESTLATTPENSLKMTDHKISPSLSKRFSFKDYNHLFINNLNTNHLFPKHTLSNQSHHNIEKNIKFQQPDSEQTASHGSSRGLSKQQLEAIALINLLIIKK